MSAFRRTRAGPAEAGHYVQERPVDWISLEPPCSDSSNVTQKSIDTAPGLADDARGTNTKTETLTLERPQIRKPLGMEGKLCGD